MQPQFREGRPRGLCRCYRCTRMQALGLKSRPAFIDYGAGNDSSRDFSAEQAAGGCK